MKKQIIILLMLILTSCSAKNIDYKYFCFVPSDKSGWYDLDNDCYERKNNSYFHSELSYCPSLDSFKYFSDYGLWYDYGYEAFWIEDNNVEFSLNDKIYYCEFRSTCLREVDIMLEAIYKYIYSAIDPIRE